MNRIAAFVLVCTCAPARGQEYTAERTTDHGIPVIRLADPMNGVDVAIVPSVGNTAYEMNVHGKNILYFPYSDVSEFQKKPQLSGIPFLAPWANRLNEQACVLITYLIGLPGTRRLASAMIWSAR